MQRKPFPFMQSGYRKLCKFWWKYWLSPLSYVRAVRSYWNRARYGYDENDLFSFDCYLAHWMPSALENLFFQMKKRLVLTTNDLRDMMAMIEAWKGLQHTTWTCKCWDNKENWHGKNKYWEKHDEYWRRRWDYGSQVFIRRIRWLWW